MLVSVQWESAIIACIFPPWASLPSPHPIPSRSSQRVRLGSLLCSNFSAAIHFTHGNVHMSRLLSPFILLSPSPTVSTSPFSMSASPFLPCREVHQYRFSRLHVYVLIYDICFSLSDLCHSHTLFLKATGPWESYDYLKHYILDTNDQLFWKLNILNCVTLIHLFCYVKTTFQHCQSSTRK